MISDKSQITRRKFVASATGATLGVVAASGLSACASPEPEVEEELTERIEHTLYIGTYTNGESKGIYRTVMNGDTGELAPPTLSVEAANPSFIAHHPGKPMLYAVNEQMQFEGEKTGAVSAFEYEPLSTDSRLVNQQPTHGGAPCYISLDRTGRWAFVANYVNGYVASFPIDADGRLGAAISVMQHEGQSINASRQEGPHAHCILLDPSGQFAYAPDLGIDKVMIYRLDAQTGRLSTNDIPYAEVEPGAGPRHITFHPDGRHAFLINELDSTIVAFRHNPDSGELTAIDTVSTLPSDFTGDSWCADIHVHPNGRYVYGSNRGHNSIAIVRFDEAEGRLTFVGAESTQGDWPRNFTLDPSGEFLLAANQKSDDIVVFRIDADTGMLTPAGHSIKTPTPVCLKFA